MTRIELIEDHHFDDVVHICANMREMDRREIFATRYDDDPMQLALDIMAIRGSTWILYWNDRPAALVGAMACWPRHVTMHAIGTDDWPRVVLSVTKLLARVILPMLRDCGILSAHVFVLAAYQQARDWMKRLGGVEAGFMPGFGRDGEDFVLMTWRP